MNASVDTIGAWNSVFAIYLLEMRWFYQDRFLYVEGGMLGDRFVGMENSRVLFYLPEEVVIKLRFWKRCGKGFHLAFRVHYWNAGLEGISSYASVSYHVLQLLPESQ